MNDVINSLVSSASPLILLLVAGFADRLNWRWLIFISVALLGAAEFAFAFVQFASVVAANGGRGVISVNSIVYGLAGLTAFALLRARWRVALKRFFLSRPGRDSLIDLVAMLYLLQALIIYVLPALLQQLPAFAPNQTTDAPASNLVSLLINSATFALAAVLVVNADLRRTWQQMLERLGWAKLHFADISWGLVGAFAAFVISAIIASIGYVVDPSGAAIAREYTGQISLAAGSTLGLALIVIVAGFMEETLFRGAIQLRLGLVRTAGLFAILHVGYGLLSFAALALLLIGILFGLLRQRRGNTLAPAIAHAGYNLLIVLVSLL